MSRAKEITHNIVFGDMLVNWFIGGAMTLFPKAVDQILGTSTMLPLSVYRVLGIIFLGFAAWQTWALRSRRETGSMSLFFAAFMALGPVALLTAALLFLPVPLRETWRVVLWIGDLYMLVLGVWYVSLGRRVQREL